MFLEILCSVELLCLWWQLRDDFYNSAANRHKFDDAMKKIEQQVLEGSEETGPHILGARQSITALFLSKTALSGQLKWGTWFLRATA